MKTVYLQPQEAIPHAEQQADWKIPEDWVKDFPQVLDLDPSSYGDDCTTVSARIVRTASDHPKRKKRCEEFATNLEEIFLGGTLFGFVLAAVALWPY